MYNLGLIGHPVKHSLSPWIHNCFFEKSGLKGKYELYEISPNRFDRDIKRLKQKLDGFNVTLPYKEKIIKHLDQLDVTAKESGAVNTVVKKNDRWIGYNTDGIGFIRSLKTVFPKLLEEDSTRALIIGAGGASRGIFQALHLEGLKQIDLANRTINKAHLIAQYFQADTNVYSLTEAEGKLSLFDLIIQTTSVGMSPKDGESIMNQFKLKDSAVVCDIVYQPIETNFLKKAKEAKAHIHRGHTMLLYQALYAFEIWTGVQIELEDLDVKLKLKLKGN